MGSFYSPLFICCCAFSTALFIDALRSNSSDPELAFPPISIHRQSRTLKQDIRKLAGGLINELVDSFSSDSKDSKTAEDVYTGQIVGGIDSSIDRYPFICSLRHARTKKHFCGCSLIRKDIVLTAAHCVNHSDSTFNLPVVHIGRYHRNTKTGGYEEFNTKKTVLHPGWDSVSNANDLALLLLSEDATYQPIYLKREKPRVKAQLTVLGWGKTSEKGDAAEKLQEVVVPVLSQKECRKTYGSRISDAMFCAGILEGGVDACQGDSGGPIIEKHAKGSDKLVGVVSWGHGCARRGKPGVYASVSHALNWIETEMKNINSFPTSPPTKPSGNDQSSKASNCHCSEDGWSGGTRTPRLGCKKHLQEHGDAEYFCMVKEGPSCDSSYPSKAYPGASWMLCDPPSDSPVESPNLPRLPSPSWLRGRSVKLKLGPLSFQLNFGDNDDEKADGCDCSEDGVSGSIQTEFKGCRQHSQKKGRHDHWCMVRGGTAGCPQAKPSKDYKGAAWRGCIPPKQ